MKTFYLLRHAHAEDFAPQGGDRMRPLSPQGMAAASSIGRYMKDHGMRPMIVIHSSALRTTQTTALVMAELATPITPIADDSLYQADPHDVFSLIQKTDDTADSLLIVGHNPTMAELAHYMGKVMHYPPGTLCAFSADCENWADFSPHTVKLTARFSPD